MPKLSVGSKAPEFTLPDGNGGTVSLKLLKGKTVILYFYPKDNTSGCTREALRPYFDGLASKPLTLSHSSSRSR